ncbi:MAG: hypothetical protein HY735_25555 [Verrucomicrobia bacterium]|nr:hypothetical protein [Verrucomicrobiota bacterium]
MNPEEDCGSATNNSGDSLHEPAGGYGNQRQYVSKVLPAAEGRQFFFALTSLLGPYSPLAGMLVARASSARKTPCRGCVDNSLSQH